MSKSDPILTGALDFLAGHGWKINPEPIPSSGAEEPEPISDSSSDSSSSSSSSDDDPLTISCYNCGKHYTIDQLGYCVRCELEFCDQCTYHTFHSRTDKNWVVCTVCWEYEREVADPKSPCFDCIRSDVLCGVCEKKVCETQSHGQYCIRCHLFTCEYDIDYCDRCNEEVCDTCVKESKYPEPNARHFGDTFRICKMHLERPRWVDFITSEKDLNDPTTKLCVEWIEREYPHYQWEPFKRKHNSQQGEWPALCKRVCREIEFSKGDLTDVFDHVLLNTTLISSSSSSSSSNLNSSSSSR